MIKTRDFLLFAVAFVFLLVGIGGTVLHDHWQSSNRQMAAVLFADTSVPEEAEVLLEKTNHQENINRLRQQLLDGAGQVEAGDPVFTSVDQITSASDSVVSNRAVMWCGVRRNDSALLASWPTDSIIKTVEGARLVMSDEETKLQLPGVPVVRSNSACIQGVVVGVTVNGDLIRNDEAFRYIATSENQLVGWALDGFPIYGAKSNTDGLDQCGGMVNGSYGYYLRASEDFVLGCFTGTPISI